MVLFCYNLEYDTHKQVSIRAENLENIEIDENNEDDSFDEENRNKNNRNIS